MKRVLLASKATFGTERSHVDKITCGPASRHGLEVFGMGTRAPFVTTSHIRSQDDPDCNTLN